MSEGSSFQEKIEGVVREDPRYSAEAYCFLRDALEAALRQRKKAKRDASPHVSGAELLEAFRVHGLKEFGPMALTVLEYWGVRSCEDVGQMVFNLVNAGVFGKTDADTLDSFRNVYDFHDAFSAPFRPPGKLLSELPSLGVQPQP
jgi:uncharacterized repeat protein (TIGR04138 family)